MLRRGKEPARRRSRVPGEPALRKPATGSPLRDQEIVFLGLARPASALAIPCARRSLAMGSQKNWPELRPPSSQVGVSGRRDGRINRQSE